MQHWPNADAWEPQGRVSTVMLGKNILKREGPFALEGISEHACRAGNMMYMIRDGEMVSNHDMNRIRGISVNDAAIRKLKPGYFKCG